MLFCKSQKILLLVHLLLVVSQQLTTLFKNKLAVIKAL